MRSIDKNRRQFNYPRDHKKDYEKYLINDSKSLEGDSGKKIFSTKKDIFILSAILGAKHGKKDTFEEKVVFTADFKEYAGIIYGIALDEAKSPLVLKVDNNKFKKDYIENLIEEYACGGFKMLRERLEQKGKTPLEALEDLLEEEVLGAKDNLDLEALGEILL